MRCTHIDENSPFVAADWFKTAGLQCVLKVRMRPGPAIRTSWYQIWEQAVALTVLCVQPGEKGLAQIYGRQKLHFAYWELGLSETIAGGQPRIAIVMLNEARQGLTLGVPDDTS